jgi:HKD family nuclease
MTLVDYIAQPASRTTLDAIGHIAKSAGAESMDVAAAYITSGGVIDLTRKINTSMGSAWKGLKKRWITSFDYCRTDPVALDALLSIPSSSIRIHDAHFCLEHNCMPKVPFHPKAFLFRGNQCDYVLAGSGNISRSGLSRGIEVGLAIRVNRIASSEQTSSVAVKTLRAWFSATWNSATPLDAALLAKYRELFEATDNLKSPVPTEDDLASSDVSRNALSSKDLQKLRVCRNLWIEAGNITRNRGPNVPGNQLMMKRLSRVFFGFNSSAVPQNTAIGTIEMRFNEGAIGHYSLTYSDNGMDKLVLPIPGSEGPPAYDNQGLLFRRMTPNLFRLALGSQSDKPTWLKKSKAIDAAFKMTGSGRQWGVF